MKNKLKYKHIFKKILKLPPTGQEIKDYKIKKSLTNDELFVLNVKLSAYDIGLLKSDNEKIVSAYLISEFERAKKRLEEERRYNEVNTKYFKEFLESKGEYMSDYEIKRTVQGYQPFYSRANDLYREYLGTSFALNAKREEL